MRVFYRALSSKTHVVYGQAGPAEFCCEAMRERWGALIGFGVPGYRRTTGREVAIFSTIPQANDRAVVALTPIDFCPFCGETIEVCRVK